MLDWRKLEPGEWRERSERGQRARSLASGARIEDAIFVAGMLWDDARVVGERGRQVLKVGGGREIVGKTWSAERGARNESVTVTTAIRGQDATAECPRGVKVFGCKSSFHEYENDLSALLVALEL